MNERYKYLLFGAGPALSIGLSAGIAIGLFITKKKIENKYLEISNREIAEAKVFYSTLYKKDDFETPESTAESLGLGESLVTEAAQALQNYQGTPVVVKKGKHKGKTTVVIEDATPQSVSIDVDSATSEDGEVVHNIFVDSIPMEKTDDFDYEEEFKKRTPDVPYVVSKEEFFTNDPEHEQVTITYYAGDDVLVDEKEVVIPNSDSVVGDENLLHFGHGSGNPHLVYIRNEKINLDFEVVGNNGRYTEQVLGFKHADRPHRKSRRSRGDDN
jgi:hypothetical protein